MDKEELLGVIKAQKFEIERLNKNYDRIYNQNCILREKNNITDVYGIVLNKLQELKGSDSNGQ